MLVKCVLAPGATFPKRNKASDAGYDLFALHDVSINPQTRELIDTGVRVEISPGYYGRVAPRSGLALKEWLDIGGGVIDSGYRNSIGVILINNSQKIYHVKAGDRIAQLIIETCADADFQVVEELGVSERDQAGFGSSGNR